METHSLTHDSLPAVPWQITGNHWLSIPCVHPADAAIHALGVLHRGARSAVEFAGHEDFLSGTSILVLASHSLPLLKEWCNRAILLDHGRIVAAGSVDEVAAVYQNGSA